MREMPISTDENTLNFVVPLAMYGALSLSHIASESLVTNIWMDANFKTVQNTFNGTTKGGGRESSVRNVFARQ